MGLNDDLASVLLSTKVGTLRGGAQMYGELSYVIDQAEADIIERVARETGHAARSASSLSRRTGLELGSQMSERFDVFSEKRLKLILDRVSETVGQQLRMPPPSMLTDRFLRGDVEKFMAQAADEAAKRAAAVIRAGGDPADAVRQLRQRAETVARSAANAAHNSAVMAIAQANKKVVTGVMALATLDARTTDLCHGRHGGAWSLETKQPLAWSKTRIPFPGRPPWHFNCRTTLSPVMVNEDVPNTQTLDPESWLSSPAGRQALGSDKVDRYLGGRITKAQLLNVR